MQNLYNGIYKNRRILVTGHTGFKGSWLCLLLKELGAEVFGYALDPPTDPNLFQKAGVADIITSYKGDIRDYNTLLRVMRTVNPEMVIHMAAQPLVRESYKNPLETYSTNVLGTVNLLEAVRHTPGIGSVVNVTSDKCYENQEWSWGYRESDIIGGYDTYSSSKGCSELVTSAFRNSYFNPSSYSEHKVGIATARAGNVIGGGDWAADRLIPDFVRAILKNEKVIVRNPEAIRPWQFVLEALNGYLTLAEKLFVEGDVYSGAWNFGPDDRDARSVGWIINRLCKSWGNDADYELNETPQPHEANYLKLDCSKAKALLSWYPRWNIEQAIDSIIYFTKAWKNGDEIRKVCFDQIHAFSNFNKSVDI